MTTLADIAQRIVEAYGQALESAREGLQTHDNPAWLDKLDEWASNAVGVIFVWVRIVSAAACLLWSFFLCVLPLFLATWLIVLIIATATPFGPKG